MMVSNDTGLPIEYEWVWVNAALEGDELLEEARYRLAENERQRVSAGTFIGGK